jgi:sugar phosphate isomerase/epimerase
MPSDGYKPSHGNIKVPGMKAPTFSRLLLLTLSVLPLMSVPLPGRAAEPTPASVAPDAGLFRPDNLAAWCIVPFDKAKRSPEERAAMLEKLGITKFVYDYRKEHISQWDEELEALRRHKVELLGWWFPGGLNEEARNTLALFQRHGVKPQLWITGGGGSVQAATPEEQEHRVAAEVARIRPIAEAAAPQGLKVGLYNHGAWFGEPENQIEIIERLKSAGITNIGIVYNQHHGHGHIERFTELMTRMRPYLICVNLNGMDLGGDTRGRKIIPLGVGTEDVRLLSILRKSGYKGPIGILNHTNEDAEARLSDNLAGLRWLLPQLDGLPASTKPQYLSWQETEASVAQKPKP